MSAAGGVARGRPLWQRLLAEGPRDGRALLERLAIDHGRHEVVDDHGFPLRVPPGFVDRMTIGDSGDPLLRQVLPVADEGRDAPGFVHDPVGDLAALKTTGLIQKYRGRALVTLTGACAIHCRYCFRRHFPYAEQSPRGAEWQTTLERIAADPELVEIVLSGGDPLMLPDERLAEFARSLAAIPQVRRLRLHTRLPVVVPERIDGAFCDWFSALPCQRVVVVHANHPGELDATVAGAMARLASAGATLLNQSVLLAGVNDDVEVLAALSERLFEIGVLPYYLHLLDRVAGAAHFEVSRAAAVAMHEALSARLPGYLVPRLVEERPGLPAKQPVLPETAGRPG